MSSPSKHVIVERGAPRIIQRATPAASELDDIPAAQAPRKPKAPYPIFQTGNSLIEAERVERESAARLEEQRLAEEAARIAAEAAQRKAERDADLAREDERRAEQEADDHLVRKMLGIASTPKNRSSAGGSPFHPGSSRTHTNHPSPNLGGSTTEFTSDVIIGAPPAASAVVELPGSVRSVRTVMVSRRHTIEHNDFLIEQSILQDAQQQRDAYETLVSAAIDSAAKSDRSLLKSIYNSRARARLDTSLDKATKLCVVNAAAVERDILQDTDFEIAQRVGRLAQEKLDTTAHEQQESAQIQWAIHYVHAQVAQLFGGAVAKGREHQLILETFTPFVCRKLAAWRMQAARAAFTMSRLRDFRAPTMEEIRRDRVLNVVQNATNTAVTGAAVVQRSPMVMESLFRAWPTDTVEQLFGAAIANQLKGRADATVRPYSYRTIQLLEQRDAGMQVEGLLPDERPLEAGVRSYRAGEYIFFSGDRSSELFYIERGAVELIVVRDSRSTAVSNGRVGDIVDATLGPINVKRKSKGKDNGVVVETLGPHDYFGEAEVLLRGSRGVSALCTEDTNVFVFTRHAVYNVLSALPTLVVDALRNEAARRREEQCRRSFPMLVEDLRREPRLTFWDVRALSDLASRFVPMELRRTAHREYRNQSLELALYFVVSGRLAVTAERTAPPPIAVRSVDGATVYADDTLPLIEPVAPPPSSQPATPNESAILPNAPEDQAAEARRATTVTQNATPERVEIARVSPGEFYGIESALLGHDAYDRQHYKNVRVEPLEDCVTWMIPRLAFSDLAIMHPVGVVESRNIINKAYAASLTRRPSSQVPVLANDPLIRYLCPVACLQKVWDRGAQPLLLSAGDAICRSGEVMTKPVLYVVLSGCVNVRSGLDVKRPTSEYVVIRDTPFSGFIVGGFEFGTRTNVFVDSVTCVSTCQVWVVDRTALDTEIINTKPLVWSRMTSNSIRDTLIQRHADGTLDAVMEELYRPCDAR